MRPDLIALTDDDLAALTNRGTVKRARQEVEAGALTVTYTKADDGTLTVRWSDDVECVLPAGKPLAQARCTCSVEPPCRHIVRSVMALTPDLPPSPRPAGEHPPQTSPSFLPTKEETRGRKGDGGMDPGHLFELVRSAKPTARCHSLGTVTRFLVPGDPNFSVCDCGQPAPCEHAWMALRAFELLPEGAESGIVDTRTTPYPVPSEAVSAVDALLGELIQLGLAGAPSVFWDRLQRVEKQARRAGLIWPAECLLELEVLKEGYTARDSRFDPATLALLVGELILRNEATLANNGSVPPLFVRGTAADKTLELVSAKLIGLGAGGRLRREGVQLTAFLQDETTGQVVAVQRDSPRASIAKGVTLAELAAGRALVRGAKRSPGGIMSFGRAPLAVHPQTFTWEKLRAPVFAETFAEVRARLATLPPTPLRPRRLAEGFHVVPVAQVQGSGFDTTEQAVVALLADSEGGEVRLVHPYHAANAAGSEALLAALGEGHLCFVAGRFQRRGAVLFVEPTSVVCETGDGRMIVQPWLDSGSRTRTEHSIPGLSDQQRTQQFLTEALPQALGDLLIGGGEAITELDSRRWQESAQQAEALGFVRIPRLLAALATGDISPLRTLLSLTALAADL